MSRSHGHGWVFSRTAREGICVAVLSATVLLGTATTLSAVSHPSLSQTTVPEAIRGLLSGPTPSSVGRRVRLLEWTVLRAFYEERGYEPIWASTGSGGASLRAALEQLAYEGLAPAEYHLAEIERLILARRDVETSALMDVLQTDALLAAARDLATGRVEPRILHPGWGVAPRPFDARDVLRRIAAGDELGLVFASLRPAGLEYRRTVAAFLRYRQHGERPWPAVAIRRLQAGDSGVAVVALRQRLDDELGTSLGASPFFDAVLDTAVRAWQRARGLEPDGIVGPETHAELRIPATFRARQLALALERIRWENPPAGLRIEVRIPAFDLRALDGGNELLSMSVIAGRTNWPTPVFDDSIEAIVLSPYWTVPDRIAALEVLPAVRRDPSYLARNHMRLLNRDGRIVPLDRIDWGKAVASGFPYRFRQDPGPDNPLGGIKFLLPNPYDVYLHDTNARALFASADRARSHGCIRVEQPLALALLLLQGSEWDRNRVLAAIERGVERRIPLAPAVPVSIRYVTAWVTPDGTVHFRRDLYGHDERLARALDDGSMPRTAIVGERCSGSSAAS